MKVACHSTVSSHLRGMARVSADWSLVSVSATRGHTSHHLGGPPTTSSVNTRAAGAVYRAERADRRRFIHVIERLQPGPLTLRKRREGALTRLSQRDRVDRLAEVTLPRVRPTFPARFGQLVETFAVQNGLSRTEQDMEGVHCSWLKLHCAVLLGTLADTQRLVVFLYDYSITMRL